MKIDKWIARATLGQPVAGHEAAQAGFIPQLIFHVRYPQEQFPSWFIQ